MSAVLPCCRNKLLNCQLSNCLCGLSKTFEPLHPFQWNLLMMRGVLSLIWHLPISKQLLCQLNIQRKVVNMTGSLPHAGRSSFCCQSGPLPPCAQQTLPAYFSCWWPHSRWYTDWCTGAEDTALKGSCTEGDWGGCCVSYSNHLGSAADG